MLEQSGCMLYNGNDRPTRVAAECNSRRRCRGAQMAPRGDDAIRMRAMTFFAAGLIDASFVLAREITT